MSEDAPHEAPSPDEGAEAGAGAHALPRILKADAAHGASIRGIFDGAHAPRLIKRRVLRRIQQVDDELAQAHREAEQLKAQAHAEAEAARERARQEGFEQGLSELTSALARARRAYDEQIELAEQDMLELAVRLAERIVHHQITLDPEVARAMVAGALERVRDRRHVTVWLHPEDRQAIERWRDELTDSVAAQTLHFEADARIERGGCMIETEAGRVDARLQVQLESLKRALSS